MQEEGEEEEKEDEEEDEEGEEEEEETFELRIVWILTYAFGARPSSVIRTFFANNLNFSFVFSSSSDFPLVIQKRFLLQSTFKFSKCRIRSMVDRSVSQSMARAVT